MSAAGDQEGVESAAVPVDDGDGAAFTDGDQVAAVTRPGEGGRFRDAQGPAGAAAVAVGEAGTIVRVDEREQVLTGAWVPGRGEGGRRAEERVVAGSVACGDPERVAAQVGDPVAVGGPPREQHSLLVGQGPADATVRVEREQVSLADGDDE